MATLPLELHHVLEEEYVSMYGPLEKSRTAYDADQLVDERWARHILYECGVDDTKKSVVQLLNEVELKDLVNSPALTDESRDVLKKHKNTCFIEDRRRLVDDAFRGAVKPFRDIRMETVFSAVHKRAEQKKPRTALCISGGGVRSATFGLGVIQGLAGANILDKFHYLSTVSGGGYMGSWLSSWVRRHPEGVSGVQADLQRADTAIGAQQQIDPIVGTKGTIERRDPPQQKISPEPPPLRHLREYSNYLSPSLSLLSGDTWTVAALYLRNLLLNLLVLVPLLALVLAAPRMFSALLQRTDSTVSPVWWAWIAAWGLTFSFAYLGWKRPVEQGHRAQSTRTITTDGRFIVWCIVPLLIAAAAIAVFWARVSQPKYAHFLYDGSTIRAVIWSVVATSLIPYALYYWRFNRNILPAARRSNFTDSKTFERRLLLKQATELVAVVVSMATAAAMLVLLAVKVFDAPIRPVSIAATLPPIERVLEASSPQAQLYVCFAIPLIMLAFFVQGSIFVGLSGKVNEDYDREWFGRGGAWLLLTAFIVAAFSFLAVFGPIAFYFAPVATASTGATAGIIAAVLGFSSRTPAKKKNEPTKREKASGAASKLSVPLFAAAVLAAISLGTTWLIQQFNENNPRLIQPDQYAQLAILEAEYKRPEATRAGEGTLKSTAPRVDMSEVRATAHLQVVQQTTPTEVVLFIVAALAAVALSTMIGANKFSLHAFYRNRLIRGYLGASRYNRDPDRFTGFDEHDNIQMWEMRPELLWPSNVRKREELVAAMQDPKNAAPHALWNAFDPATRTALETRIDAVAIEGFVQNVNVLLMDDTTPLATRLNVTEPAWLTVRDARGNVLPQFPHYIRNRATLDSVLATWVDCMVPPADAVGAPVPKRSVKRSATKLTVNDDETAAKVPVTTETPQARAPLHILNGALNLTTGENLAWQERKAAAFSMSPYHSGSFVVGYRSSKEYGGEDGISLGTAATISGAAASPNMGYSSSTPLAFLLTFFNLRLGTWLGNPGPRGEKTYKLQNPRTGLVPLFSELTGNSNAKRKWVNLSDGGHFENLGLYEMVLRRCHDIVVSDGGHDPKATFEDLANAIRKIRIDFGIPIDVKSIEQVKPRTADRDGRPVEGGYIVTADIRYDAVDENGQPGRLTYIKPGLYKGEYFPVDVFNYAMESPTFPHETTADQFFSESQFESYRALARHAVDVICKNPRAVVDPRTNVAVPVTKTYDNVLGFSTDVRA